jgi:hypothetical protein
VRRPFTRWCKTALGFGTTLSVLAAAPCSQSRVLKPLIQIDIEALAARLLLFSASDMPTKTLVVVTVRASAASV